MNSREMLLHIANFYGDMTENLAAGLRNAFDALRLYDYAQAHPELDEYPDTWEPEDRIAALGYDPLQDGIDGNYRESEVTGAVEPVQALADAYVLLDSVPFVTVTGDRDEVVAAAEKLFGADFLRNAALLSKKLALEVARKVDRTAAGTAFYGEAMRLALKLPGLTDGQREALTAYSNGTQKSTDHIRLQEVAFALRDYAKA